jgi:hypothetical protein
MDERLKNIVEETKREACSDRKRVSLYLSASAMNDFKRACGEAPPSKVLERLMRLFSESNGSAA